MCFEVDVSSWTKREKKKKKTSTLELGSIPNCTDVPMSDFGHFLQLFQTWIAIALWTAKVLNLLGNSNVDMPAC